MPIFSLLALSLSYYINFQLSFFERIVVNPLKRSVKPISEFFRMVLHFNFLLERLGALIGSLETNVWR
jgi:hypothetical protein